MTATTTPDTSQDGFGPWREIFNGRDLTGWRPIPRIPAPMWPGGPYHQDVYPGYMEKCATTSGRWEVIDGAIVGGQEPPGCGLGGYLLSEEVFGDFELTYDIKPDWPADTGVLVRATEMGTQGLQILCDHRQSGGIGGFYGNGTGSFHALAFNIDAVRDADGRPVGLKIESPQETREPVTDAKKALLSYAAQPEEFLAAWRWGDWNTFKVRCVGKYPVLTSWVNGVKLYQLDTGAMDWPTYDRDAVATLLGRAGHIALEVHDNDPGLGAGRWGPGAVVRWRHLAVRESAIADPT
ncbi:MAG: DUF1080 domain-containing protein [Bifidobacteriaceae bacterium]|jgi:hypothetical protein|nr:DUF1080 domain-containing protein [Bifidobacteriaceae bacterium]